MPAGYTVDSGTFALTTGAKTIWNMRAASGKPLRLCEFSVSFDGVTASAVAATIELCMSTNATAGTAGATPTPVQIRGKTRTADSTAGVRYTAEPTVLTPAKSWYIPQFNGVWGQQYGLGREVECDGGAAIALRIAVSANVNGRSYAEIEEG